MNQGHSKRIRTIVFAVLAIVFAQPAIAQISYLPPGSNRGVIAGGFGITTIDGQPFYTFSLRPEVNLGKFGFGLDIPFRYNADTRLRRQTDWDEDYDYLRTIRFVRYGQKREPFYLRAGELEWTRIGHGFIVSYYNNNVINFEGRKVGLTLDADAGVAGFETLFSNIGRGEIIGGRAYVRPMYGWGFPLLDNLAIGVSAVSDIDPDQNRATPDRVTVYGTDVELPLLSTPLFETLAYADVARIGGFGSGTAVGLEARMRGLLGTFQLTAQLERRFTGDQFIAGYFDGFYELDRYRVQGDTVFTKQQALAERKSASGTFGLLHANVLGTLEVLGSYERRDGVQNSGHLHLHGFVPETVPKLSARATYDRTGIGSFGDLLRLDNRSVARFGLGYRISPFLVFFMDYVWTYRFDRDLNGYVVQKRVEPQITFAYPFRLGG